MAFQSQVRLAQTTGIIGDIIFDGPKRVAPYDLTTTGTSLTIGKAFTEVTGEDGTASPGNIGGGAFAGVLINTKSHALQGTTAGSLQPTRDLTEGTNAELLKMGTILVRLDPVDTGLVGEPIFYTDITGNLGSGTAAAGETQILNAKIDRQNIGGAGLAIITLTEAE